MPETSARVNQHTEPTALGWLLTIAGALGLIASATLILDRIALLKNPDYVPTCNFGAVLSCSNVMQSPAAEAFGFPNPLIGIVSFPVVIALGLVVASRFALPVWMWTGLQIGALFGVGFVHWLMYQSFFVIKFLCPWCIVVWIVTILIFWYVTVRNLRAWKPQSRLTSTLGNWHGLIVGLWLLAVLIGVLFRNFA